MPRRYPAIAPEDRPDRQVDRDRDEADRQRDPRAVEQPRQDVAARAVRARGGGPAQGGLPNALESGRDRIVRGDDRGEDREDGQHDDDDRGRPSPAGCAGTAARRAGAGTSVADIVRQLRDPDRQTRDDDDRVRRPHDVSPVRRRASMRALVRQAGHEYADPRVDVRVGDVGDEVGSG